LIVETQLTVAYDLGGHNKEREEDDDGDERHGAAVTVRLRLSVGAVERMKTVGSTKRTNQADVTDRENDQRNEYNKNCR